MNPRTFFKRPINIQAERVTSANIQEIAAWCNGAVQARPTGLYVPTLEGPLFAQLGDWIIRGIRGEFYPCKPDIFEATYDEVVGSQDPT